MQPVERNPIDAVWTDRPPPPLVPARPHSLRFAGRSADEKRAEIGKALSDAKQDAAVLTDPASIAWLLNIRGGDVPFTPFALGFALVHADGGVELFMDAGQAAGGDARLAGQRRLDRRAGGAGAGPGQAGRQAGAGRSVRLAGLVRPAPARGRRDGGGRRRSLPAAQGVQERGRAAGRAQRPCAGRGGGVPVPALAVRARARRPRDRECPPRRKLLALRQQEEGFRGESFPAISGAGEHGAIIHYRVTPESNRPIRPNEVYLIDSGAQYPDGTTDITRTVWTGPDAAPAALRERVTRVMQGHIAIATLVFPSGVGGAHLDAFARRALWAAGLDYDHGTGHGVGSYLSVHEGPVSPVASRAPGADRRRHDPVERAGLSICRIITASGWRTCCWCSRPICLARASRSCGSRR